MTPRLIKIKNIWHCAIKGSKWLGVGYTPALAYRDWAQFRGGA